MDKPIVVTPPKKIEFPIIKEVFEYKDLLYFVVLRDIKTRFQQTFIGVLWIIFQPLIQMLLFYVVLGVLVKVPTGDIPYPVFFLTGYIVWQVFNQIVNGSAYSLVGNIGIITKTYFPKLILPLSITIGTIIDFAISFILLFIFLYGNNFAISSRYYLLPLLLLLTLIFSLGVGLLFSALMVIFRDIKNLLGFIMQIWMFLTPIMYPITIIPEQYRFLIFVNPMTGLVDAFRWVFLGTEPLPSLMHLTISLITAFILLISGLYAFRTMEIRVADVL